MIIQKARQIMKTLSNNNIYFGDAYELIKQVTDNSIDCIYTDIPYLFETGGGGRSDLSKRINRLNYEELKDIRNGIDYSIFDEFYRVMKKVNLFIWCSKLQLIDILHYWTSKPDVNYEVLFWAKTNPSPMTNNTWLPDVEYCLYFREKGVRLNDGYDIKSKWYQSTINKVDKDLYNHPTIKPLELVKRHIQHATNENDIVMDPFLGSGTTVIAAKELNRQYIGFEVSENYFNIASDRLNYVSQVDRKMEKAGFINIFDLLTD
jgi:DNA modification methylase